MGPLCEARVCQQATTDIPPKGPNILGGHAGNVHKRLPDEAGRLGYKLALLQETARGRSDSVVDVLLRTQISSVTVAGQFFVIGVIHATGKQRYVKC